MSDKKWNYYIFILLLCISCYLPAIPVFTDSRLLPKWYASIISLLLIIIMHNQTTALHMSRIMCIYAAISVVECIYVFFMYMIYGDIGCAAMGTFDNPAGLALGICIATPFTTARAVMSRGAIKTCAWTISLLLLVATLLLSQSRTGLICLSVQALYFLFRWRIRRSVLTRYHMGVIILMVSSLVWIFSNISLSKVDSTSGREFILRQSASLIAEHPLTGRGINGFEHDYMLQQASYFHDIPDSPYAMLADEVSHPLNEFVYVWVNYGVLGVVFLLAVLFFPHYRYAVCRHEELRHLIMPLIAITIFSCFSYPFHYPVTWLIISMSVFFSVLPIIKKVTAFFPKPLLLVRISAASFLLFVVIDVYHEFRWNQAYLQSYRRKDEAVLSEYESLHGYFRDNVYFLYNYAVTLYYARHFDRAYSVLEECEQYWNGYDRELLAADVCYNRGDYMKAVPHYSLANDMCPVRFAPLEGLYNTYVAMDSIRLANIIAAEIQNKKIKIQSPDAIRIKGACKTINSLTN